MSRVKLKVPSSARRHIKIEQFSPFVSASRLRQVQSLLNPGHGSQQLDGILCISGIDSRYNDCMYELLNYLLFGFFDVRRNELESSGFAEEVIDDLMVLICKDHVEIYCNPVNYHYFLPYVSHWPSLQFHCLAEHEYEGEENDAAEEFKIRALIAMLRDCKALGIPFSGKGQNAKFDSMAIEKWPIIQAYALDDFGSGGFFTMNFQVLDVSSKVHQLQDVQDPVTVEILLTEHLPLLSRQWDNMMKCVQMSLESSAAFISQKKVLEPLQSYYNHGLVGHKRSLSNTPFVVFTSDTDRQTLSKVQKGESLDNPKDLVLKRQSATHMICQVVSPNNPLVCTRTYFFCPFSFPGNDEKARGRSTSESDTELRYASTIYLSMVRAVLAAIEMYSHTASCMRAEKKCRETLVEECGYLNNSNLQTYLSNSSSFVFSLKTMGLDSSLNEDVTSKRMKSISLTLYNIPAVHSKEFNLGSMVFTETFLDSRITCNGSTDVSSDYLILTSNIPRYQLWSMNGHSKQHTVSPPSVHADLWGEMLMIQPDIFMMGTWPAMLPPEKVTLSVWKHGLSVKTSEYGYFLLHGTEMNSISLYDGDSMSQVTLLTVEVALTPDLSSRLPPHLSADADETGLFRVVFAFNPHTKAHTQLYGNVLPEWKNESKVPSVERLEYLEPDIEPIHFYLQNKLEVLTTSEGTSTALKKCAADVPDLFDFLEHLSESCGLQNPVSLDTYQTLTGNVEEPHGKVGEKIVVTVIGGAPGSEKNTLASVLTSYNKNAINWLIYRQPDECNVDTGFLHRSMTAAVETRNQWLLTKSTRVILIAPGFCDTTQVLQAMNSHPDQAIRAEFCVGAVTICIDPLNTFMEHKMTLPCLMSQCAQGWVNNILFTSQTTTPNETLENIQTLIRSINSNVALLKAESGNVRRSTDLDLIMSETAFKNPELQRARVLLKPHWCTDPFSAWPCRPKMKDVVLRFTIPLEKHLTLIKLRGITKTLKCYPFIGNIYFVHGFLAFSGNPGMVDLQYIPLSNKLSLNETRDLAYISEGDDLGKQQVYFMSFTGVGLKEQDLKTFLSSCVKQKPERKKPLVRKDLSVKDIEKIHEKHHLDELPDGWFYNGSQFVSMTGERSQKHPSLDKFVQAYLDQKNAEIEKFNNRIESDAYVDLWN